MQFPSHLQAVIFDMDGLLLATEGTYRRAIFETSTHLGFEMTDAVHLSLVGTPRDLADRRLLAHFGRGFPVDEFNRRYKDRFEELCADGIDLRPGAKPLLGALKQRAIPMAVATSAPRTKADAHLEQAGIRHYFQVVIGRDDVSEGKPAPDCYLLAAARMGVQPAHCLALEDSHNGVRAALAAGMATVMVPDLLPATDELRHACIGVLTSLDELIPLLPPKVASFP